MNREVDNMISLHVYMTPKANKEGELEAGIRDKWMAAMSEQRGFLRAALLKPFPDEELDKLQAAKPASTFETVAFWRTEEERLAWVARPIHDQIFNPLLELADDVSYTLQTVVQDWNL